MLHQLAQIPRSAKQAIMIACDVVLLALIVWLAFVLRFEAFLPAEYLAVWWLSLAVPALTLPCFMVTGLYRAIVRYLGAQAITSIIQGVTLSTFAFIALVAALRIDGSVPRTAYVLYWGLAVLAIGGSRYAARTWFRQLIRGLSGSERVAIYGAGAAGVQLAQGMDAEQSFDLICFIDDDPNLHGRVVHGLKVHAPADLPMLIERQDIHRVLLAIPSARRSRRREIVDGLHGLGIKVMTMPGIVDILSGNARIDEVREVRIEDLLGRDPVMPSLELMERCIRDKNVLVTGAGGSIGSELCRQILMLRPKTLVLLEQSEFALYQIDRELLSDSIVERTATRVVPLLGSVVDAQRVRRILETFQVHTVYHAAAYKHVPIVEGNVLEAVQNNIFGTLHAAQAAEAAGVERFVLISTDKAVRPTNVMGATKRFAELILQAMADRGRQETIFSMVRFGNVLGSSGSVVPLFREQIAQGGPVTVTHPEVTRYFMTIPEAAALVIQAGSMGTGGDVFVLDMGEPVKILDLARRMVQLTGLEVQDEAHPDGDIRVAFTGLRPGEKLYEELLLGENISATEHSMIMRAEEAFLPYGGLKELLDVFRAADRGFECQSAIQILERAVDGFSGNGLGHDLMAREMAGTEQAGVASFNMAVAPAPAKVAGA